MGLRVNRYIARYPSALKPEIVKRCADNKKRIFEELGAAEAARHFGIAAEEVVIVI